MAQNKRLSHEHDLTPNCIIFTALTTFIQCTTVTVLHFGLKIQQPNCFVPFCLQYSVKYCSGAQCYKQHTNSNINNHRYNYGNISEKLIWLSVLPHNSSSCIPSQIKCVTTTANPRQFFFSYTELYLQLREIWEL